MKVHLNRKVIQSAVATILITSSFSLQGQWRQTEKVVASDRDINNLFGGAVAISGNYAIVGAYQNSEDESGNNFLASSGAAYIYKKDEVGNWIQIQKITASDRAASDRFGNSVAISGNYAVIGAFFKKGEDLGGAALFASGAAYIFKNDGSDNWVEIQKLVGVPPAENDLFGQSVAIHEDYVIVGAPGDDSNAGKAYLYKNDGFDNWTSAGQIISNDLSTGDRFGNAVAIHGDYAIIGASDEQHNVGGGSPLVDSGSAYIFKNNGSGFWSQTQKIVGSDRSTPDRFGLSVSINGDYAIVGAANKTVVEASGGSLTFAGAAYIFKKDESDNWAEEEKLVASDFNISDRFGWSVAISDSYAIVGAPYEDEDDEGNNTSSNSGSIYIFKNEGFGNWTQESKITAANRNEEDEFGTSVAISDGQVFVGARREDEDQSEGNTIENSGAAYFLQYKDSQTITFDMPNDKRYGETFDLPETSDAGLPIAYRSENESLATITGNTLSAVGAGTVSITAAQGGNDSYWEAQEVSQNLTIRKAELTVTANDINKTYGDDNPALTYTYSGFVLSDNQSQLSSEPSITTDAETSSNTGTYSITTSGGQADNYSFNHIPGTLNVSKATLLVTPDNKTKTYGDDNPALTYTYSGFVLNENENQLSTEPSILTDAGTTSMAGSYLIKSSGGLADNYSFNHVPGTLTVSKAALTVTADDKTKAYGDANPTLTYVYSGFVNNEDESQLSAEPTIETVAQTNSNAGSYGITPSGGLAVNYSFNRVPGTLTVNKATLTATASDISLNEGESFPAVFQVDYTGFVLNEDASVLDTPPLAVADVTDTSVPGTYNIKVSNGQDNNYEFIYEFGVLTVNEVLGLLNENAIAVYPNPTTDFIKIGQKDVSTVEIFDLKGNQVLKSTARTIDVTTLENGIYILKLKDVDGQVLSSNRIVKR